MSQYFIGKATLLALGLCLLGDAAQARQYGGEDRQVRVACDLQANGRLANCAVVSRYGADERFDAVAERAALAARVWPMTAEPGRIHFPILFDVRRGDALETASSMELRLRVGGPADGPKGAPAAPEGVQARPWGGLTCVVSDSPELKTCGPKLEEAPGPTGGNLVWFEPVRTPSGAVIDLPDALPAPIDEVRRSWAPAGRVDDFDYFFQELSRSEGVHLGWLAEVDEADAASFILTEFDCPNRRARQLFSVVETDDGMQHGWRPSGWFSTELAPGPDQAVCGTGA